MGEASLAFIESWEARLGFKRVEAESVVPWQSLKDLSHRYAEGWLGDGSWLDPIDQLTACHGAVENGHLWALQNRPLQGG